jgi:hypothetical protein
MTEYLTQIPENIQQHIKEVTKTSGLPDTDESIQLISQGWLEKKRTFEEKIDSENMQEIDMLDKNDDRGAIVMTYSGSIINIGPLVGDGRKIEYASIGLRKDVPDFLVKDASNLKSDVIIDEEVEFTNGPVKQTSPAFKIIVCDDSLSAKEQERKFTKVSTFIAEEFADINNTMLQNIKTKS